MSAARTLAAALVRLAEALPLVLFLAWIKLAPPQAWIEWRGPYYAATGAALAVGIAYLATHRPLNRIHLALGCYFASGALALALAWQPLNQLYGRLEATAMLAWVVAVGLASLLVSPRGFVGVAAGPARTRRASLLLLAIAVGALGLSWACLGDELWSAYVPFVALFTAQGVLQARLAQAARTSST